MSTKHVRLNLRCEPDEVSRWRKLADQSSMSLSDWIRHTLDRGRALKITTK